MAIRTSLISFGLLAALGLWSNAPAQAAEVTILVNQGAVSGVRDLAAAFEKASGHKVVVDFVGLQQTNVIQPVAGTQYLGPLPPDLIEYGRFAVAVRNVSKNQEVARDLVKFMTSAEAAPLLRKSGMEPPAR